jgi:hypothetical protein
MRMSFIRAPFIRGFADSPQGTDAWMNDRIRGWPGRLALPNCTLQKGEQNSTFKQDYRRHSNLIDNTGKWPHRRFATATASTYIWHDLRSAGSAGSAGYDDECSVFH